MRTFRALLLGVALAALVGCNQREARLLVAYSGDCQGYFEPCG